MMKNYWNKLLAVLLTVLLTGQLSMVAAETEASSAESNVLTLGVVPQQAASKLLYAWEPIIDALQRQTGLQVRFKTAPDIPTFEQRLAQGQYDLAYMNPYHFTVFNRGNEGYQALARAKNKQIQGILVVRKDSAMQQLEDLDGETLAFPAPAAFAATLLSQANLKAAGVSFQSRYVSSHDSVYQSVAAGLFTAGGGIVRTLNALDPSVRAQLRILWTSPGYTPHALAYHPRLSADVVTSIRQTLLSLDSQAPVNAGLDRLKIGGFTAASNTDWDDVRELDITIDLGLSD